LQLDRWRHRTSGGTWLTGSGSAGGGNTAPGRAAARSGWISGAGGFLAPSFFGGVGRANVGTGVKVVSRCGGAPGMPSVVGVLGVFGVCARFLRRLLFVES
jgi:hypothetical protein